MPDLLASVAITLAVVSTVVLLPGGQTRWILPKLVLIAVACAVGVLAPRAGRLPRWWWIAAAGAGALLLVSALLADAPLAALMGRWPRYEGLVALPAYAALVWLGARLLGPSTPRCRMVLLSRAASWASIALAGVALLDALGAGLIASDSARSGSLTGSATDQGILGAVFASLLLGRLLFDRVSGGRALLWVGAAAGLVSVVLSASRAALVAGAVALAVLALAQVAAGRARPIVAPARRDLLVLAGAGLVLGVGALVAPLTRTRLTGGDAVLAGDGDRPLIWSDVWSVLQEQPWLGWGPSGLEDAVGAAHSAEWYAEVGPFTTLDSPHNLLLQSWGAGGVGLLLIGLGMLVWTAIATMRAWRAGASSWLLPVAWAAGAATLVALMFSVTSPASVALPLLLWGAAVAVEPRDAAGGARARVASALLGVWALLLLVTTAAEVALASAESTAARGDVPASERAIDTALALRPWDADTASIGAQLLAQAADSGAAGAWEPAVAFADRALAGTPGSISAAKARAVALSAGADPVAAEQAWAALAERLPLDWWVAHRHGASLAALAQWDEARLELERALALDPGNASVTATLEAVRARQP